MGLPVVYISEAHARVWGVTDAAGNPLGSISLADLRLVPVELAALDEATVYEKVRTQLGAPADSVVEEIIPDDQRLWIAADERGKLLGMATVATLGLTPEEATASDQAGLHRRIRQMLGLADVRIESPQQHRLAQHLLAALGNRPAAGRDITPDAAAQQATDAAIYAELVERYIAVHSACQSLIDGLRAAGTDVERTIMLRQALGWGVTSISDPADREALLAALSGVVPPANARALVDLAETTAQALAVRLVAAPAVADLVAPAQIGAPLLDHEQRKRDQRPDGVPTLAQAIVNLASPHAKLAILACWSQAALLGNTQLDVLQNELALDENWLTVVAAVRPPLARLEALQLELPNPLVAWSSSPGDPWRTGEDQVVQKNLQARRDASALEMQLNERFVAAYGSATTWAREKVALGLIDSF
ncbi:MAG: hypothetical protein AVDCRST_MAG93-4427, partial [uncultured Chloroflexia bacterium]